MSVPRSAAIVAAALFAVAPMASAALYSFRDGISGYDGTQDASLYAGGDVNTNTGALTVTYAAEAHRSIIKFDLSSLAGLTVSGPATLSLFVADTSVGPEGSGQPTIGPEFLNFSIHSITDANAGWSQGDNVFAAADPGEVTYNNMSHPSSPWAGSAGLTTSGTDYDTPAVYTGLYDQKPTAEGTAVVISLPASLVQHWIDVANAGLRISVDPTGQGAGAAQFYSSEGSTLLRPLLEVEAIPEPASATMLGLAGIAILARRRK